MSLSASQKLERRACQPQLFKIWHELGKEVQKEWVNKVEDLDKLFESTAYYHTDGKEIDYEQIWKDSACVRTFAKTSNVPIMKCRTT